jgi:nitrile hydratase accessory protein
VAVEHSATGPVGDAGHGAGERAGPHGAGTRGPDRQIADMAGPSALPRRNGELVFESAWAARVFGMTVGLHQSWTFAWNEFRDRLIAEIGDAERQGRDSGYYERWFAAFERVLADRGLVSRAELDARTAEFERGLRDDVF